MAFDAIDIALTQLSVKEATGKNDGEPLERYGLKGEDPAPWCARFVRWCFLAAGEPLPGNKWKLGSVTEMEDALKHAGAWFDKSVTPARGDIVFFDTRGQSDAGPGRHVGLVENAYGGKITTIEGNLSNRVARVTHSLADGRISGFARWPTRART